MFILLHFSPHSWVIENSFDFCDRIFNLSADVCQQCLASFAKHEASSPVPEGGLKVVGSPACPACPARHSAIQRRDLWLDWRISRGYREKDRCGLLQATTGGCLGCRIDAEIDAELDGPEIRSKHGIQALKEPDEALWALQKTSAIDVAARWKPGWKPGNYRRKYCENLWKSSRLDG